MADDFYLIEVCDAVFLTDFSELVTVDPNPSNGVFTVWFNQNLMGDKDNLIELFDVAGRLIAQ